MHAELFYNTIVTILLLLGLFIGLLLIIFLLYIKPLKKGFFSVFVFLLLVLGGIYSGGHAYYKNFLTLSKEATPNLRDREKNFLGYRYYDGVTLASYQHIQNVEGIRRLGIYDSRPVTKEITYLGSAYGAVYFKVGRRQYYLRRTPEFVEGVTPQLTGKQYFLKESAKEFQSIGFFPQTNDYLEKIRLPKSMAQLEYVPQEGIMSKDFASSQSDWAVGRNETVD